MNTESLLERIPAVVVAGEVLVILTTLLLSRFVGRKYWDTHLCMGVSMWIAVSSMYVSGFTIRTPTLLGLLGISGYAILNGTLMGTVYGVARNYPIGHRRIDRLYATLPWLGTFYIAGGMALGLLFHGVWREAVLTLAAAAAVFLSWWMGMSQRQLTFMLRRIPIGIYMACGLLLLLPLSRLIV